MSSRLGGVGDRGLSEPEQDHIHHEQPGEGGGEKQLGGDNQLREDGEEEQHGEGGGETSQHDAGDPGGGFGRDEGPADCFGEESGQASPRWLLLKNPEKFSAQLLAAGVPGNMWVRRSLKNLRQKSRL